MVKNIKLEENKRNILIILLEYEWYMCIILSYVLWSIMKMTHVLKTDL